MTIKYAIVGAGTMGQEHIRNIEIYEILFDLRDFFYLYQVSDKLDN